MNIWERVKLMASGVWDFLAPFVRIFLSKAGQALAVSALAAVKVVAESMAEASGREKREAAYAAIVTDLQQQGVQIGIEVTASMINAALEAAVQKLKADG